ncbi:uncharacterized protein LOC144451637 [Glandiceps talaboti]
MSRESTEYIYESLDIEDDDLRKEEPACCCETLDRAITQPGATCRQRTDYLAMFAMACFVIGVIAIIVGYLIPRYTAIEPTDTPAQEYEKLEAYYAALKNGSDIAIIAGLVLLGVGGVIMSSLLLLSTLENCRKGAHDDGELPLLIVRKRMTVEDDRKNLMEGEDGEHHYGSTLAER